MHPTNLPIIGYSYGNSSRNKDAENGPILFKKFSQNNPHLIWQTIVTNNGQNLTKLAALPEVIKISTKLANAVAKCIAEHGKFIVIGGDHSSAIGTWNGVAKTLSTTEKLGLIWIDAHLDSHTPQSSHSKNIHGMPAATLLGQGYPELTQITQTKPVIEPNNLKMIGMTDYEPEEIQLLSSLNVEITQLQQITDPYQTIITAYEAITQTSNKFGVSLDLDVFTKNIAPGVTTFAPNGIDPEPTIAAIKTLSKHPNFIGLEIAEFTPCNDIENKTATLIEKILTEVFISS